MRSVSCRRLAAVASLILAVSVLSVFATSAAAQTFSYGGIVFGRPSCVSTDVMLSEEVTCVLRGSNNDLYSIQVNPRTGATFGFQTLGFTTSIVGNPSCAWLAAIMCTVRGLENELYGIIFDPVTMASTGLRRLESAGEVRPLAGDPSCITGGVFTALNPNLPLGEMTCGVRGKDNGFYVARFSGTPQGFRTSSIERLDPNQVIVGDPSCAGTGVVICAARAADSSLAVIRVGAGGFFRLDGPVPTGRVLGDPSCASTEVRPQFIAAGGTVLTSSPLVTCGVRGNDSALYVIRFFIDGFGGGIVGGAFLGEQTLGYDVPTYLGLGGVLTGNPSCASTPFQTLTCGMRGHDGNLYLMDVHTVTGSNTGTHDRQTIVIAADPACVTFGVTFGELAQNNVTCGVADLNNGLSTVASIRPAVF